MSDVEASELYKSRAEDLGGLGGEASEGQASAIQKADLILKRDFHQNGSCAWEVFS